MNEAELLFTDILGCDRLSLYLERQRLLDNDKSSLVCAALKRRVRREPIQYILGKTEFMGLDFKVDKNVFIPRPETEVLVETALKIVKKLKCSNVRMLDLGTGSGCIAISLAKFIPWAEIYATDISPGALAMARMNARLNSVEDKVNFMESDLFISDKLRTKSYDIIVTNPPYIPAAEIEKLQPEIQYEPRIALDGGGDGLDFYRRIAKESWPYLSPQGLLIMEIGFGQKEGIKNIFQKQGLFEIIEVIKDHSNIERVAVVQKKRQNG